MRAIDVSKQTAPAAVAVGTAPILQWLDIELLVVDDSYQRELGRANWSAIRRIAENFRWAHFSPVFVAPIEGGKYAIIDGQHRTHAAALCGIAAVPCAIVPMSREEQAASFAAVNGLVTKVTLFQIYKAALVAGEEWALACARACSEADCRLMTHHGSTDSKRAGEVYCIGLVRQAIEQGKGSAFTLALAGIRKSEFGEDPDAYSNEILRPLFMALSDRPWLVAKGIDLSGFMDAFDIYAAIDRATDFVKAKRRQGLTGIARWDMAAAEIGAGLDKAFPQRMAAPPMVG
ncbi:MAG TPA: DUF6551 family protein [Pelagibacterium sp.]|uniref:ParB N-terminal domain-containing protein n=1 Tax=Pelagibacterium sp. TaxID=1967288 RepID=UPI002CCD8A2C|nr:DUF6551 family protein [Pelagibacterium sp.]HWJ86909.1 DUF6551 family protein [Pelagibacterium sp.]